MTRSLLLLLTSLTAAVACDGGVTPACPPMPAIDPVTGELVGPTPYDDPSLGPGGALQRWQLDAAEQGCATLPANFGGSSAGGSSAHSEGGSAP